MIDVNDYTIWISAAAGWIIGGTLTGLVVRARLKTVYEQKQSEIDVQKKWLEEKLASKKEAAEALSYQLDQREAQTRQLQSDVAKRDIAKAKLETMVQNIPSLEKKLKDLKSGYAELQIDLRQTSAQLAKALEKAEQLEKVVEEKVRKEALLQTSQDRNAKLQVKIAELSTSLEDERKQAAEKIALLNEARDQLKNEFQNLAQRILDEKGRVFAEQNQANMDRLITPLRDQIGDFKKRVEDVYDKESRDRVSLQAQIHNLKELNQRISKDALNLTRALKGDSKARGNWGEIVLERVLEASGLENGREYETQVSLKNHDGKRYQPDVIVHLPQGKDVVVDAKVSLIDYETYHSSEDADQKTTALKSHIEAVRTHIKALAGKRYEDLKGVRSLDFVLMFVPVEAAFWAAVEQDQKLFGEAFEKNIMVVGPSTLLVTLRTIENVWRHEYQNRHAVEIAKKAGGLYDKFVGFVDALQDVGRELDKAVSAYQTAFDRLGRGRGNLIRRTQELKALGVKAGKELPKNLLEMVQDEAPADD